LIWSRARDAAAGDVLNQAGDQAVRLRHSPDEGGNFRLAEAMNASRRPCPHTRSYADLPSGPGCHFGDGDGALQALFRNAADDLIELPAFADAGVGDANRRHWDHLDFVLVSFHATSSMEMRSVRE
jgi:hypothetical protein